MPSRGRPGASWRKEERRAPHRRLSAFPGRQPPEHIQILVGSVPGSRCLSPLNLEEPYDVFPLLPGRLPGPQLYVKEHLAPAGDLPFQLDLKSMPLAQNEAINVLLGGHRTWDSSERVVDLASGPPLETPGPLFWVVFLRFVLSDGKRLLCPLHPVSPVLRGRAQKKKATRRSVHRTTTLTDIKRPQAIAVVSKYLV
jgi:hypothetical protein